MNILFIGDIIGRPGRVVLSKLMPCLKEEYRPDLIIANGENSAAGYGITEKTAAEIFHLGVHVITGGNHIWDKHETEEWISQEDRILRPANYPPSAPGQGWAILPIKGMKVAVVSMQGRVTMPPIDCPFRTMETILESLTDVKTIFVDFHAEATSEKEAFGRYFDGKVSAVVGTHTHIQTADERILEGGTAYISDAGLTGGTGGVIGYAYDDVMVRFLTGIPHRLEPDKKDPAAMGVSITINDAGKAENIVRFQMRP